MRLFLKAYISATAYCNNHHSTSFDSPVYPVSSLKPDKRLVAAISHAPHLCLESSHQILDHSEIELLEFCSDSALEDARCWRLPAVFVYSLLELTPKALDWSDLRRRWRIVRTCNCRYFQLLQLLRNGCFVVRCSEIWPKYYFFPRW